MLFFRYQSILLSAIWRSREENTVARGLLERWMLPELLIARNCSILQLHKVYWCCFSNCALYVWQRTVYQHLVAPSKLSATPKPCRDRHSHQIAANTVKSAPLTSLSCRQSHETWHSLKQSPVSNSATALSLVIFTPDDFMIFTQILTGVWRQFQRKKKKKKK